MIGYAEEARALIISDTLVLHKAISAVGGSDRSIMHTISTLSVNLKMRLFRLYLVAFSFSYSPRLFIQGMTDASWLLS